MQQGSGSEVRNLDQNDWVTLWQSELAGLAVDRESQERVAIFGDAWTQAASEHAHETRRDHAAPGNDRPAGRPGADAAFGTAPVGSAFGAVNDELVGLLRRIAELQHRS